MSRREALRGEVIEEVLDLDVVAVEDVVYFPALEEVSKVGQSMQVLRDQWRGDTPPRDTDPAK